MHPHTLPTLSLIHISLKISKKPFPTQARRPFTFQEINFFIACLSSIVNLHEAAVLPFTGCIPVSYTHLVLTYMLSTELLPKYKGSVRSDELGLPVTESGLVLPCGASGRWESGER